MVFTVFQFMLNFGRLLGYFLIKVIYGLTAHVNFEDLLQHVIGPKA